MGQLPTRTGSYCVTTETKGTLVSRELGQRVEEMEGFSETPFYFPSGYLWLIVQSLADLSRAGVPPLMLHTLLIRLLNKDTGT